MKYCKQVSGDKYMLFTNQKIQTITSNLKICRA